MATTTNFELETPTPGGYRNTWGGTLNTTVTKLDELVALALPLGTIQMYPLATAPVATTNGGTWLLCNGASLSRVTYATLFALIGTTYGNVDGNTFTLPDMRARSPLGYNTATISGRSTRALALGSGVETHALSTGELAAHSHAIPATAHSHPITDVTHTHTGSASGKTASASAVISDPQHDHPSLSTVTSWMGGGDYASTGTHIGQARDAHRTGSNSTGITDSGHSHSFTTTAELTGITATQTSVIGITATTPDTGSGTAHENMHPYLVINYIILAKHPSF
jgi:microcystin-dependent protein